MASQRIKGITIELGADASKFTKALAEVDKMLNSTQKNLKDLNNALKLDPTNVNLIKDKQRELADQIQETESKIKTEKEALEAMKNTEGFDKNSKAARDLQTQIDLDTSALKQLKEEAKSCQSVFGTVMTEMGKHLEEVGSKIKDVGDKISGIGQDLTTKVTVPITAAFGASAKSAIDWESAFTGVMKTVDETANTTYDDLKNEINEIAEVTASSQNDIAAVMEIAGQLGVSADNISEFTKVMVMLGDTTNLTSEEAASSIAKFANVTNMSLDDVDKLGAAIVDLGNNYATTEADIMEMATRLSGAGAQIGLSQGEILGLATAMSSVGIQAEMGGSAMSKAMIKMQVAVETGFDQVNELTQKAGMSLRDIELMSTNNTKGFKELASSLGMTTTEIKEVIKNGNNLTNFAEVAGTTTEEFVKLYREDAPGALQAFISGLGDTDGHGASTIAMLQDMGFTEVRLRDTLTRLANSQGLVSEAMKQGNQAYGDNSALATEAEKRYTTMAAQIQQTKNKITEVAVEIGEMLLPYIQKGIDYIEQLIEKWKGLDDSQKQLILTIAAVVAAVGPVLMVVGKVVSGIGTLVSVAGSVSTAIGGIITVLGSAAAPIAAIIAVIAALTAAFVHLYQTDEEFAAKVDEIFAQIQTSLGELWAMIQPALEGLGQAFQELMVALEPVFEFLMECVAGFLEGVLSAVPTIIEAVKGAVTFVTELIKAFGAYFTGDTDAAFEHVKNAVKGLMDFWENMFKAKLDVIIGFFNHFGIDLKAKANEMVSNLKARWTELKTNTINMFNEMLNNANTTFNNMKAGITSRVNEIKDNIVNGIKGAVEYITSLPSRAWNWGADIVGGIAEGIRDTIDNITDAIEDVADVIASYIHFSEPDVGPLSNFHTFMPDMMEEMAQGINKGIPMLKDAMGDMASTLVPSSMATSGVTNTRNVTANNTFNITVNGAGKDVFALADELTEIIQDNINAQVYNQEAVYA